VAFLGQTTTQIPGLPFGSSTTNLASSLATQQPSRVRAITPSSANSPYYYSSGGFKPRTITTPTIPKPFGNLPPGTVAGGTGGTQPPQGLPDNRPLPGQLTWDEIYNAIAGDPIRISQIGALNEQLKGRWATDVIARAQSAELAYGGVPISPTGVTTGQPLNLSQFAAPYLFDPNPKAPIGQLGSVGTSLYDALMDPGQLAATQGNEFSVLRSIQRQLDQANSAGVASAGARLGVSGEIQQLQDEHFLAAQQSRQEAGNQFLGVLQDLFSNYLDLYNTGQGQYGQYNQDALNRYIQILQSAPPAAPPPTPTPPPEEPGGPPDDYLPAPSLTEPILPPTLLPGYGGTGAGGFTGSTTPPAVIYPGGTVQQPAAVGSNDSPYYYGGGGRKPRR